jgi:hypothetical protein
LKNAAIAVCGAVAILRGPVSGCFPHIAREVCQNRSDVCVPRAFSFATLKASLHMGFIGRSVHTQVINSCDFESHFQEAEVYG